MVAGEGELHQQALDEVLEGVDGFFDERVVP